MQLNFGLGSEKKTSSAFSCISILIQLISIAIATGQIGLMNSICCHLNQQVTNRRWLMHAEVHELKDKVVGNLEQILFVVFA